MCTMSSLFAATFTGHIVKSDERLLSLYYVSNFLTDTKVVVDTCFVDQNGMFHFEFTPDKIRTYYIDLGTKRAQVTLEPNQNLDADLPSYIAVGKKEYLDPYFSKENIMIYNIDEHDVNYYLTEIEVKTTIWLDSVIHSSSPGYIAEKALVELDEYSKSLTNSFLVEYLHFSTSFFYQVAHQENPIAIKQHYLRSANVDLHNPAFVRLFQEEYVNSFLASDGYFIDIVGEAMMGEKLPSDFVERIQKSLRIEHLPMAELICVKGFFDAAIYAPNYKETCYTLLTQLHEQISTVDVKQLCMSTSQRMGKLIEGKPAPYYELYTPRGKKVPLVLKRRNVLVAFMNTNILDCQQHLALLEKFKANYKRKIEIVCVAVYQSREELERFIDRNDYDGIYFTLWDDNYDLLQDYDVKALPKYSLIGNDGNLIFSSMPLPDEDMQEWLRSVMAE